MKRAYARLDGQPEPPRAPWEELVENPAYGVGIDDGDRFVRRCDLQPSDADYLPEPSTSR